MCTIACVSTFAELGDELKAAQDLKSLKNQILKLNKKVNSLEKSNDTKLDFKSTTIRPVIGSPIFSRKDHALGLDMISGYSSSLTEVSMLNTKKKLAAKYGKNVYTYPSLYVSGELQGQVTLTDEKIVDGLILMTTGVAKYNSDIKLKPELSSVKVAFGSDINQMASALLSFKYDSRSASGAFLEGRRLNDEKFSLDKGLIVIGNLDTSPAYFSFGYKQDNFGKYKTSVPGLQLASKLAAGKAIGINLGYSTEDTDVQVSVNQGDLKVSGGKKCRTIYDRYY